LCVAVGKGMSPVLADLVWPRPRTWVEWVSSPLGDRYNYKTAVQVLELWSVTVFVERR
jgi:hypothetical protein